MVTEEKVQRNTEKGTQGVTAKLSIFLTVLRVEVYEISLTYVLIHRHHTHVGINLGDGLGIVHTDARIFNRKENTDKEVISNFPRFKSIEVLIP